MKFGKTLDRLVDADLATGNAVFLGGPSAIGKSSYLQNLADRHNTQVFTMNCNVLETKEDLNGARIVPTEDGSTYQQMFFPLRTVQMAVAYANAHPDETPILFGDELNRTTPGTVSALLTAHTDRTIGDVDLPENLRLVFAGNMQGNISMFDQATISRFSVYKVNADAETFMDIHDGQLHEFIVKVLKDNPSYIYCEPEINNAYNTPDDDDDDDDDNDVTFDPHAAFVESEQLSQIAAPRTIVALNRVLTEHWDNEFVKEMLNTESDSGQQNLFEERVFGYTGDTKFSHALINEFMQSLVGNTVNVASGNNTIAAPSSYMNFESMSNYDDIVAHAKSLNEVVAQRSLLYALTSPRTVAPTIVKALSEVVTDLTNDDIKLLMANTMELEKRPFRALLDSSSPLSTNPMIKNIGDLINA